MISLYSRTFITVKWFHRTKRDTAAGETWSKTVPAVHQSVSLCSRNDHFKVSSYFPSLPWVCLCWADTPLTDSQILVVSWFCVSIAKGWDWDWGLKIRSCVTHFSLRDTKCFDLTGVMSPIPVKICKKPLLLPFLVVTWLQGEGRGTPHTVSSTELQET